MKMTKKGTIQVPKEEVWTGKCRNCGSEYTASRDELMREDSGVDAKKNYIFSMLHQDTPFASYADIRFILTGL